MAAERGNAAGQYFLGDAYYIGRGTERDFTRAYGWFREAAEQGQLEAEIALGLMYEWGDGVQKDPAQALAWWDKAAKHADADQAALLAKLRQSVAAEIDAAVKKAP
jgi:TPR repeat protein